MKKALFTLFVLGAFQGFSQTAGREQSGRTAVSKEPVTTGRRTETPPSTPSQPSTTTQPATTGNEQSPSKPATTIDPHKKYVSRSTLPQSKAAPVVKENP